MCIPRRSRRPHIEACLSCRARTIHLIWLGWMTWRISWAAILEAGDLRPPATLEVLAATSPVLS